MMDPFLGIGHSALAAKACKIGHFIGFDIDPEYVKVARFAVETGITQPTFDLLEHAQRGRKRISGDNSLFER